MEKTQVKPQAMLFPLPAVMVSCVAEGYAANIITISWIGIINSEPPMLSISVQPKRYSYDIIKKSGEFVVNLTGEKHLKAADFCGTKSGRDFDKFKEMNLTPVPGKIVMAPLIGECPVNLECKVRQTIVLGSHEMFMAEIVMVHIDKDKLDKNVRPLIDAIKPLVYCPAAREYRGGLEKMLARYGAAAREIRNR
nr:flavin reductase family protein [candidate division Zixibacteria bacterium]